MDEISIIMSNTLSSDYATRTQGKSVNNKYS
jgi:hypothetical protein